MDAAWELLQGGESQHPGSPRILQPGLAQSWPHAASVCGIAWQERESIWKVPSQSFWLSTGEASVYAQTLHCNSTTFIEGPL